MVNRSTNIFHSQAQKGFSFIELLVTAAIVALVFGGLFAAVQAMINLINDSKSKAGATALATERLEFIRSLEYDAVGTVGGVPSGLIPQYSTTTINNTVYSERVLIEYVDDPADGFGAADSNSIQTDYKRVKVEYSWEKKGNTSSVSLVSNVSPVGIESTVGGGTIRVNVFDATVQPVAGASVRFVNDTTTTTIDTVRFTDSEGVAYLSGAPASAGYQIFATRSGYSTDGTTLPSGTNPNPITPPVAVLESAVSTMNFQIDLLSDLTLKTRGLIVSNQFTDTFNTATNVASTSSTTLQSGAYELTLDSVNYAPSGTLRSVAVAPTPLAAWYAATFVASTTVDTEVLVSVYYFNGSDFVPVPDSDLPGNSTGFNSGLINLEDLDINSYNSLALFATLNTADGAQTPQLHEWNLEYIETLPVEPNVDFVLKSEKSAGTDDSGISIPKLSITDSTDGAGVFSYNDIEWGSYELTITNPGLNIVEQCPPNPIVITPDSEMDIVLSVDTTSSDYLHVVVTDAGGTPIPNATVNLEKGSVPYDRTQTTSLCGQTVFSGAGLSPEGGYTLTVSAPGYATNQVLGVNVSATSTQTVILN